MSSTTTLERPVAMSDFDEPAPAKYVDRATSKKRKGTALRVAGHGPGFVFGCEPHGKVLPIHIAERCGRTAEQLVADGDMQWTDEEPVGEWKTEIPPNMEGSAVLDAMTEELDRIRRSNFELTGINRQLDGENAELKRTKENQTRQLGEQSEQIGHWRKLAEDRVEQLAKMTAAYEERSTTVESLQGKNEELETRLAALLKVAPPGKKAKDTAPVG